MLLFLRRGVAHLFCNFADFALAALKCLADSSISTSIVEHPGNPIILGLRIPYHPALSEIGIIPCQG
jgi:hypothetical protein